MKIITTAEAIATNAHPVSLEKATESISKAIVTCADEGGSVSLVHIPVGEATIIVITCAIEERS